MNKSPLAAEAFIYRFTMQDLNQLALTHKNAYTATASAFGASVDELKDAIVEGLVVISPDKTELASKHFNRAVEISSVLPNYNPSELMPVQPRPISYKHILAEQLRQQAEADDIEPIDFESLAEIVVDHQSDPDT